MVFFPCNAISEEREVNQYDWIVTVVSSTPGGGAKRLCGGYNSLKAAEPCVVERGVA